MIDYGSQDHRDRHEAFVERIGGLPLKLWPLDQKQRQDRITALKAEIKDWSGRRAEHAADAEGTEFWEDMLAIMYDDLAYHTKLLTGA